jgi:hypothetical protein
MERLHYETKKDPLQPEAFAGRGKQSSEYLTKISKLIPSEIIAGYLAMFGFVGDIPKNLQTAVYWLIVMVCLILTPLYLNVVSTPNKPKRNHLIISTIAFVVWVYVTTGKTLQETISIEPYSHALASIILIAFCLISALIPLDR